jgi:hypothetical protein
MNEDVTLNIKENPTTETSKAPPFHKHRTGQNTRVVLPNTQEATFSGADETERRKHSGTKGRPRPEHKAEGPVRGKGLENTS